MDYIKPLILFTMKENCFDEYFIKFNFADADCFRSTLSKCLGLLIVLGSVIVKLPQIIKLYMNKSSTGINIISVLLELTAMTIHASYNLINGFPFGAWGDSATLAVQTCIVAFLVLYYGNQAKKAFSFIIIYVIICVIMMGGFTPLSVLWYMQACNIPIPMCSKFLQGWENYKNGSTGQLSAITVFMMTGGATARIFTSVQETGDPMLVITFCASTFANLLLSFQMVYYWNVETKSKKKAD